jgi:hypothetical protein
MHSVTLAQLRKSWRTAMRTLGFQEKASFFRVIGKIKQEVRFKRRRNDPPFRIELVISVADCFQDPPGYLAVLGCELAPDSLHFQPWRSFWRAEEFESALQSFLSHGLVHFDRFSTITSLIQLLEAAENEGLSVGDMLRPEAERESIRAAWTKVLAKLSDSGEFSLPSDDEHGLYNLPLSLL